MNTPFIRVVGLLLGILTTQGGAFAAEPSSDETQLPSSDSLSPTPSPAPKTVEKRDPRVPRFLDVNPQWAYHVSYSPNALGGGALVPAQGTLPASALMFSFEFQPRFIQRLGVLGLGISGSIYPIFGGTNLTSNFASIGSVGGLVRYQAKYFRQQILVPTIAYVYEGFSYSFLAGQNGVLRTHGPVYGLWLLLNPLDPPAASEFYVDAGVARTYLTLEARNLTGSDSTISIAGYSYYAGLRIEFE